MAILLLGINHKTASVALREKVAFSDEKRTLALQQLSQLEIADAAVILSTCNRTEIYFHNKDISPQQDNKWFQQCIRWFANIHQLELTALNEAIYSKHNLEAAQHLMRVACGLDSLILGEPQILGQVKQSFQFSKQFYQQLNKTVSSELSRLFQKTFAAAKRVRSETQIGENAVSVAYAACSLARQIFDNFAKTNILLVGAGETIELVSRHLLRDTVGQLTIANRTPNRVKALIEKLDTEQNINILSLNQLQQGLDSADLVITSTASQGILINQHMVKLAQKKRRFKPMLIVDIAVPRDVDERVGELDSIYYYSVDDLQNIIQHNLGQREQASKQAEQIVSEESHAFFDG